MKLTWAHIKKFANDNAEKLFFSVDAVANPIYGWVFTAAEPRHTTPEYVLSMKGRRNEVDTYEDDDFDGYTVRTDRLFLTVVVRKEG